MPSELDRRRRAIGRRAAWVRRAKIALPLGAVLLVALIFLAGRPGGDLSELFTPAELAALGAGMKLDQPRFAGVAPGGESYALAADWALPDGPVPDLIDLSRPRGQVTLTDARVIDATADQGRLSRRAETLTLDGAVRIVTSDGYTVLTDAVTLDLAAKSAAAPGRFQIDGPRARIDAGSFRLETQGGDPDTARIWFENHVRVVIAGTSP